MNSDGGESPNIKAYMRIARRWLWLIALTTLLAGAVAFAVSQSSALVYEASASLLVGQSPTTSTPDYNTLLLNERLAKAYAELIKGRPILRDAAARLGLPADAATLARLDRAVSAEITKDTQLIRITARDADPATAANIVDAVLKVFIEQDQAKLTEGFADSMQGLAREMQDLQAQIDSTQGSLDSELSNPNPNQATVTYLVGLLRNYRSTYDSFLQSYDKIRVAQAQGSSMLTVFEKAEVPSEPIPRGTRVNILMGSLVGALLSTGMAFVLEYTDDTVRRPEDAERTTELPALAMIARSPKADIDQSPLMARAPVAPVAEGYRMLRTNVQLVTSGQGQFPTVLLITGVRPSVGTTTTVGNLGVSLAQIGRQVLIIDANLRRPALHRLFQLHNDTGLTSVLLQKASLEGAVQQTSLTGLRVLTAGPLATGPVDVLHMAETDRLFEELAGMSDLVLLDSPPILGAVDARILAQKAQGALLVAEVGRTSISDLREAANTLTRTKTPLIGVVLNKARGRPTGN